MPIPTMQEVARLAGVSIGTVSRVVNNKDKVRPETRARIQALIDQVGYQPSIAAQSLAARKTNNIMLIVPNITDEYYPKLVRCMSHLWRTHGKRLWLGVSDFDPGIEAQYLNRPMKARLTGSLFHRCRLKPMCRASWSLHADRFLSSISMMNA